MLYGRVKRSPHAHARIIGIDASKALALDGVHAVVTNADFPRLDDDLADLGETFAPFRYVRDNVLASDKALYAGHAVAAVCASDPHVAEDALALIEVEYEPLPAVLNVHEAMAEGAPLVHEHLRTTEMAARFVPSDRRADEPSNTASHLRFELGDADAGFAGAENRDRARVRDGDGAPGLHRAAQRHGPLGRGRPDHGLDQHPGPVRGAPAGGEALRRAGLAREGHAGRDRRRLRRQDQRLPGADGRPALEADRPPGEDDHDPRGGADRHRPHLRHLRALQDRRDARRLDRRGRGLARLRGGRLPPARPWARARAACSPPTTSPTSAPTPGTW